MKPIVVLGIFVADTAYRAERLPRIGETLLGQGFVLGPGGKGSNQAVAAAKAGGDVHMITRLGEDAFAGMARSIWEKAGVKPAVTMDRESYTGAAFIFVDSQTGNNAIIVANGAAGRISEADIEVNRSLIEGAGVFVTQLEQPIAAARHGLAMARAAGVTTILNPAPAAELSDEMLALCDYLTPNESEAELLTGLPVTNLDQAKAAAAALLARGVGAVILTLGGNGVLYQDGRQTLHVPAVQAGQVIDTTGAGDAFNGGFAVALAEGLKIEAALRFANATAGLSVTRPGAAESSPLRAEILALLDQA